MRLAALPLLATTLTSSPLLIGGLTAAQFLPWTTFAPFGGVIVDRSDRRSLIMITQGWRAAVMAMLAVSVLADVIQIWQLFVVAFVITVGEILVDPSVVATVPTLVSRNDLDRANGRITTVETVTNDFAGGPVGAASFALAPWLPFLLDARSYAGSIIPFGRLPPSRSAPIEGDRPSVRMALGDGLRWISGHPFLRPLTIAIAVFHLGTAGHSVCSCSWSPMCSMRPGWSSGWCSRPPRMVADTTSVRWAFVFAGSFHLLGAVLLWRSFQTEPS